MISLTAGVSTSTTPSYVSSASGLALARAHPGEASTGGHRVGIARVDHTRPESESEFQTLAQTDPIRLIAWMEVMTPTRLTYAAELLGGIAAAEALPILKRLATNHPKSYVREGALLGLAQVRTPAAREVIARVASRDPNDAIRELANELLEE
jgi:hypothetical protein